jgi:hypothetical protein
MKAAGHTPGPWSYSEPGAIGKDTYSIYAYWLGRARGPLAYTAGPSDYGDSAEANARLIALAPELLEAIAVAGRIVGQLQDRQFATKSERIYALSRASDALGPIYFKATGQPLKWWEYEATARLEDYQQRNLEAKGESD